MSPVPVFSDTGEAMAAVLAGLRFAVAADATRMPVQSQAECLQMMEQADAILTAARASVLTTFTTGQGCRDDGDYSARSWLIHMTGITPGAAVGHTAWARRNPDGTTTAWNKDKTKILYSHGPPVRPG